MSKDPDSEEKERDSEGERTKRLYQNVILQKEKFMV